MASSQKKQDNDWTSWVILILLFSIGLWPIALVFLFVKLFGSDEKKNRTQAPPLQTQPTTAQAARGKEKKAGKAVRKVTKSPIARKSTAKWLKIFGVVLVFAGLIACVEPIDMMFWLGEMESYYMEDLLAGLAILVGGGAMFFSGHSMSRSLKRYPRYLAVMGDREAVPVDEIARALGYSERQVEKDLQKMIDKGYFGGKAYLHMELGYLFRSGEAGAEWKRQQESKATASAPKETENGYSGILRNIRRANDQIADPILSAKIDRLEEITAKIFREVEEHPEKRSRIDSFLNYYLPTTQKLLDSYAQFEAAGVDGANLRQAKSRIESTMDSIVKGFAHQLDELYKSDAMDVDSDIRVMETMLRRDTATIEDDFDLGGTAVQSEEDLR